MSAPRPRGRRQLPALVVFAGALGLLVGALAPGCTRDPAEALRFLVWGTPEEVRVVQGYLDAFAREHPEVPVQVEHAPSMGFRQKLQTLVRGDNVPDVFYVNEADCQWLARDGALLDLTPLVARDRAEVDPDDFFPEVFERFRLDGGLWAIAKDFTPLVVYANRDLFDKWDVPWPAPDWTWDDFLATCKALTHPEAEGGADWGFLVETWPEELFPWVWQAGGEVAREDPPAWLMGAPEHLEASAAGLQFLADLIWVHRVAPSPSVTRDQQGSSLFQRGKVGLCTYGRWACMDFKEISRFQWDVLPLPRGRRPATSTFAVGYGVGRGTRHPERAWTLVKFLTSRASQEAVAHSAQAIPVRRSVAASDALRRPRALTERGIEAASAPFVDQVPFGRFSPRFAAAAQVKATFQERVEPLWNGTQRDARALLEALQPDLEALIAQSARPAAPGE